jgi:hypothetical protein
MHMRGLTDRESGRKEADLSVGLALGDEGLENVLELRTVAIHNVQWL